jgi:hypothetical protein
MQYGERKRPEFRSIALLPKLRSLTLPVLHRCTNGPQRAAATKSVSSRRFDIASSQFDQCPMNIDQNLFQDKGSKAQKVKSKTGRELAIFLKLWPFEL